MQRKVELINFKTIFKQAPDENANLAYTATSSSVRVNLSVSAPEIATIAENASSKSTSAAIASKSS